MDKAWYKNIGPGIVIAATGIGAGDLVAASVAGSKYGTVILWSVLIGGLIKYSLNEGIARYQLATGETIVEAIKQRLHRIFGWYFLVYLLIWSFVVGAAMSGATGLAAHAIFPQLSVAWWGVIHALIALAFVFWGNYIWLERGMKFFIALMFLVVISTAFLISPNWNTILAGLLKPSIPEASGTFLLGVIGGVGGSVTLLSYSYWIKEKGWTKVSSFRFVKIDLAIAYTLTVLFGIAIIIISAELKPNIVQGNSMVLALAEKVGETTGSTGKWLFLLGFWGAVFSSMLGVWQGVPYLFSDFVSTSASSKKQKGFFYRCFQNKKLSYRLFLLFLALFPLFLLFTNKPVWIIVGYAVIGSFFMPFLAFTLIYLNTKKALLGKLRNKPLVNVLLILALLVFGILLYAEIFRLFF
ncbi:MAG: Nramp family divalent metal transporter [Bacteroidales bacterium]|nr:Nramp family divalent metal transporter [Bacteroidales bacterium]